MRHTGSQSIHAHVARADASNNGRFNVGATSYDACRQSHEVAVTDEHEGVDDTKKARQIAGCDKETPQTLSESTHAVTFIRAKRQHQAGYGGICGQWQQA